MSDLDTILQSAAEAPLPERITALSDAARQFSREAAAHLALAVALKDANRFDEAMAAAQRAVQIKPDLAAAYALLGELLVVQQKLDRATAAWETALRLEPGNAEWWAQLADANGRAGRLEIARVALNRELAIRPNHGRALVDMGRSFELISNLAEAEIWFRHAVTRAPDHQEGWHRLGVTMGKTGRLAEAIEVLTHAARLGTDKPGTWHDLGFAHEKMDHLPEAESAYRTAVSLRPADVLELNTLGRCLRLQEKLDEARTVLDRALEIDPNYKPARGERAIITLLSGDFERGWDEYECRYDAPDFPGGKPNIPVPRWTGQPLAGKTIMLWSEQGLGDTLQFLRFVPKVAALGGTVVVHVQSGLERITRTVQGAAHVGTGKIWPRVDLQIGLMSLPWVFKINASTIPAEVPYLKVEPAVMQSWVARVGPRTKPRRVGLVWAGSPHHTNDKNRSIPLERLRPWLDVPGIEWFSLQKGVAENQIAATGLPIRNLMPHATDFMESAGLVEQMDLVISVDTSVIHLAAALARPVWVLLPRMPDWRWMTVREDTPWYPTMRFFRQGISGDWDAALQRVADELRRGNVQ